MATFDPENTRIMGHVLRIIGTFLRNYRGNFENFENSILGQNMRIIYPTLFLANRPPETLYTYYKLVQEGCFNATVDS